MARTLIADVIKKDESSQPMSVDGVAKAWANINGTGTITSRNSLNVSSIADEGTGDISINFINALVDSSHGLSFSVSGDNDGKNRGAALHDVGTAPTTMSIRLATFACSTGAKSDEDNVFANVSGDLA